MKISKLFTLSAMSLAVLALASCNKKFQVTGTISDAKDSILYFENMSLNGPVTVDSVQLGEDGTFAFDGQATDAPEFYRLRIAGQIVNVCIDSTETVTVKASYPTMSSQYEVSGSDNCAKIKELALQSQINAVANDPTTGVDSVKVAVERLLVNYKDNVKRNYIFKEPMKAYAYFALFQTFTLGNIQSLVFNPRSNADDIKAYAAVATSWDANWPEAERGVNLHNIALEGMKDMRIVRNEALANRIDPNKVSVTGLIDIALQDNKGVVRKLSDLKGKVVFLDFHLFASDQSMKRIMMLRDLYNKYHAQGLEIYQIAVDPNEHFWKTQTAALPWVSVRDESGASARSYNVQGIPTYFLIDRSNSLYKRAEQIKDVEAEIKSLL